MRVAVAGGTGLVGRLVVAVLCERGHEPVVLARSAGVDLISGSGLDAALAGVEVVIDVSNVTTRSRRRSIEYFARSTEQLLAAQQRAGAGHHVVLSIVGIDRVDLGYYAGKRRQEELVLASGRPATILRATQFHQFAAQMLDSAPGPIAVLPRMRTQPIAAREVAAALVSWAESEPAARVPELAGPQEEWLPDMARRLITRRGQTRRVWSPPLPMRGIKAMTEGGLLPASDGPRGLQTFAQWLADEAT